MPKFEPSSHPHDGAGPSIAQRVENRVNAAAARRGARRALRLVFVDLGERYRRYRRETGSPISPAIRSAAVAFRAQPSLPALIPVAAFLDELSLLDW